MVNSSASHLDCHCDAVKFRIGSELRRVSDQYATVTLDRVLGVEVDRKLTSDTRCFVLRCDGCLADDEGIVRSDSHAFVF